MASSYYLYDVSWPHIIHWFVFKLLFVLLFASLSHSIIFMQYIILVPSRFADFQDGHSFNDEKLCKNFNLYASEVSHSIRKVFGINWLVENLNCFIHEMCLASLLFCMDLLLDAPLVRDLADTFSMPFLYNSLALEIALSDYSFGFGYFPYGGFMSLVELLANGWCGEILFVIRGGLIYDEFDDTLL